MNQHPEPQAAAEFPEPLPVFHEELEAQLSAMSYAGNGLAPAIVQDHETRDVLMLAWMNEAALRKTIETGHTWFWSRSRGEYWRKGDTSGDRQIVREIRYDCDCDCILVIVDQQGRGACHTGEWSCFFRTFKPVDVGITDHHGGARGATDHPPSATGAELA